MYSDFASSLLALWRQLAKISFLLLSEAVEGWNMIRYFSFRQSRHSPEDGLKLLALDNICQVTVKADPLSLSFQTWSESLVPGWCLCLSIWLYGFDHLGQHDNHDHCEPMFERGFLEIPTNSPQIKTVLHSCFVCSKLSRTAQ